MGVTVDHLFRLREFESLYLNYIRNVAGGLPTVFKTVTMVSKAINGGFDSFIPCNTFKVVLIKLK